MRYTICTVREAAATTHPDDGLMFPVPGASPDAIGLEQRDGSRIREVVAREIAVRPASARSPILHADDVRAQVYVTDSRVAVACTNYDTGGGWIGGPIALALNVLGRARARRRSRGKILVGHVRYPWLRGVHARNGGRLRGSGHLRLAVEGDGGVLHLDLVLTRDASATAVATDIIRRAARFRLDHDEDATPAQRTELERLAALPPLLWSKGDPLAGCDLPTSWPPTSRSALLGEPGARATDPPPHAPDAALAALVRRPAPPPPDDAADVTVVLRGRERDAPVGDDIDVTLRPRATGEDGAGSRRS